MAVSLPGAGGGKGAAQGLAHCTGGATDSASRLHAEAANQRPHPACWREGITACTCEFSRRQSRLRRRRLHGGSDAAHVALHASCDRCRLAIRQLSDCACADR